MIDGAVQRGGMARLVADGAQGLAFTTSRVQAELVRTQAEVNRYAAELQRHGVESVEREVRWLSELIQAERGQQGEGSPGVPRT